MSLKVLNHKAMIMNSSIVYEKIVFVEPALPHRFIVRPTDTDDNINTSICFWLV